MVGGEGKENKRGREVWRGKKGRAEMGKSELREGSKGLLMAWQREIGEERKMREKGMEVRRSKRGMEKNGLILTLEVLGILRDLYKFVWINKHTCLEILQYFGFIVNGHFDKQYIPFCAGKYCFLKYACDIIIIFTITYKLRCFMSIL